MNQIKLQSYVQEKPIVLPLSFFKLYQSWNVTIDELVLLEYLYDKDKCVFDPNSITEHLNSDLIKIMENISSLTEKGLINLLALKDEKGVMEEVFDLSPLYEKITIKLMEELNTKSESDENIHSLIELEFNRKLSPLEHEMIDDWENNNYDKELIKEALKEASLNGVNNLRYIDKILFEWNKKGIKKKEDIKKETPQNEKVEIYNCDWLDDEEEI